MFNFERSAGFEWHLSVQNLSNICWHALLFYWNEFFQLWNSFSNIIAYGKQRINERNSAEDQLSETSIKNRKTVRKYLSFSIAFIVLYRTWETSIKRNELRTKKVLVFFYHDWVLASLSNLPDEDRNEFHLKRKYQFIVLLRSVKKSTRKQQNLFIYWN